MRAKLTITKNAAGEPHTVVVTFTTDAGNDGKMVSLAFDGRRPIVANESQGWTRTEFNEYTGTPVMVNDGDLHELAVLPAALVELGGVLQFPQPVDSEPYGV